MSFYIGHNKIKSLLTEDLRKQNIAFTKLEFFSNYHVKVHTKDKRELSTEETIKIKDNLILLSRGEIGFSTCCTIIVEIVGVEHKEKIWDSLSKYDKNQMRFLEFWALLLELVES